LHASADAPIVHGMTKPNLQAFTLLSATLTMGLTAGWFGDWAHNIMPGLGATDDRTFVIEMGFNQGGIVSGHTRTLYCSGQAAMSSDGLPQHGGDMAAQSALTIDNLEAVLAEAGMSVENLVRLNVYTTDVE
jgi:enamine deaminase RidA (YjgF/YER057c/UK114 family)